MVFPQTPIEVDIALQVGGTWTDITSDVYTAEKIVITRGRADEGARVDPGKCTMTLNNRLGKYSPQNPLSPYYGLIGRNTPIRVSVPGPVSYLDLDGDPANNASTPDDPALDITGDLDLRWEGEADWYGAGARMLIGKWGDAGNRSYHLRLQDGVVHVQVATDGTAGWAYAQRLPALPRRAALRGTLDADNGSGSGDLRLYWAESLAGPWHELGNGLLTTGTITVFAGTAPLTIAPAQPDAAVPRLAMTGRVYKAEVRNGIDGTVVASPDFTAQSPGTTTFADSAGRTWTLAGNAEITNRRIRFIGEVSSWPSRWDVSGKDVRVPIEAAGILRRLGQGAKALQSTLRRRIPSANPLVYWPMEDGSAATQAASALDGGAPLVVAGMQFASDDSLPSSEALPTLGGSASLNGAVPGATAGGWHVEMVYKLEALPATEQTMLSVQLSPGTGGIAQVRARVSAAAIKIEALDGEGTVVSSFSHTGDGRADFVGVWNRLQIFSAVSGSQTYVVLAWRDVVTGVWWYVFTIYTGTPGRITSIRGSWGSDFQGMAIGHLSAFDIGGTTAPAPGVTIYEGSDDGYTGETAGERMTRLAAEENIPLRQESYPHRQQQVGPQRPDTLLTLLEEAEDVDGGILHERRDYISLAYRDRISLYSQPVALALDYTASGHVAPPLEPVDDDQKVRNDVTRQRDGGVSARAVLEEGPLSVQAPPNGVGVYDESLTLNLYSDDQAEPQAYWGLHLGTVDGARYPVVNINLAAAPDLIDDVTALESGDRMQIANLPPWLPPGPIDLLMQGYQEVIGHPIDWDVQLNCTPGAPWTVGAVAISEDFSDADYAVTITDGGDLPWFRSQAHYNSPTWSLRSGAITNNQTSDAIVTVPTGATELTFWYWTSSEESGPGFEGDRLLVLVDGVQVLRAQGITPWTQTTIDVTGKSTVTFRYAKDNSAAAGEDAVYIDDLTFTMPAPSRVDANPGGSTLALAATDTATQLLVHTPARGVGKNPVPWIISNGPAPAFPHDFPLYPQDFPLDIKLGGEVARLTECEPVAWDTFTRSVADGWGTADSGLPWVDEGGVATDRSVNGAAGVLTLAANPSTIRFERVVSNIGDCEVLTRVSVDQVATGAALMPAILLRYTDTGNFYRARLHFDVAGAMAVSVTRGTTTIGSATALTDTYSAGQWFWLRARLTGHRVQARAWPDGQVEPGVWHKDETITTDPIDTGQVGVAGSAFSTNTNVSPQLRYDDFRIPTPQLMTVERSRNGVVKPHAVGTEVRLAQPTVIAL